MGPSSLLYLLKSTEAQSSVRLNGLGRVGALERRGFGARLSAELRGSVAGRVSRDARQRSPASVWVC